MDQRFHCGKTPALHIGTMIGIWEILLILGMLGLLMLVVVGVVIVVVLLVRSRPKSPPPPRTATEPPDLKH
jgi:hypothetical protein